MPILPIDTGRYGSPEMRAVFDEEHRLQKMLDVEAALALAHAEFGNIPRRDAEIIASRASTKYVRLQTVKRIDAKIKHEAMAVVEALARACGPSGAYVHLGATASDILDTALALQIREGLEIIGGRLNELEDVLVRLSRKYARAIMVGRTHGQHSLPMTLGLKFAVWMREVSRHIERLRQCRRRILVGKMSGAVGTMAGLGDHAFEIQESVMKRLGLQAPEVTSQIVQRDRHAELIFVLVNIACSLDKFATEIRNLQRTEIGELAEPFDIKRQVGSSSMPHKMNPWMCENISSLARVMRSLMQSALENVVTWHERDMAQSASERFIVPEAFIILDHMLGRMIRILSGLRVDEARMRENLSSGDGLALSEAVMMALARNGVPRQEAHRIVRRAALKSVAVGRSFKEVLLKDRLVRRRLSEEEIGEALNPERYLGKTFELIERAILKTKEERLARGQMKAPI